MDIVQIYNRFLKDNGVYSYFIKHVRKNRILSSKNDTFNNDDNFIARFCPYGGIEDLLNNTIGSLPMYRGASTSTNRRRFYRLNKKWKDLVKTIRVQHNLSVGDTVEKITVWGNKEIYTITNFNNDGTVSAKAKYFSAKFRIYKFKNTEKKFFRNYYITNESNTYGKVSGDFNEIQL